MKITLTKDQAKRLVNLIDKELDRMFEEEQAFGRITRGSESEKLERIMIKLEIALEEANAK